MRILFDSQKEEFKSPFGPLVPGQVCRLTIRIPASVQASAVECRISYADGPQALAVPIQKTGAQGAYEIFQGAFSLEHRGLYFYYFYIHNPAGGFRLFKQGSDTNMEAGDLWQLSCVPEDFSTPDWAKGAVIYQVFPDRFYKSGDCSLTGKLEPYVLHQHWGEEVFWQPTEEGEVLNNDFYGGNFRGITEKLPYIASLGATILYLNPICKAFSSHRYDTADFKSPDPMLGTEAEFSQLCQAAHALGIRVILDAVFSHTGSNSLYFNQDGAFDTVGAANSPSSPYARWYTFYHWPDNYHAWWNFRTLPTVNKMEPSYLDYIIRDQDSVVAHWLNLGADGFRLDVADELPDEFLKLLRQRVKQLKPDALILGEVWEDASNKVAYGQRRRYFVDGELDSVMNYPYRTAILNFVRGWDTGKALKNTVMAIVENYPKAVWQCNMNLLGTHDTPRILTALVDDFDGPREEQATRRISRSQYDVAFDRLLLASFLQFTLPGSPSIYYGDEAGMEGHRDPFNRRTFPWGREDPEIQSHFIRLGRLRQEIAAFRLGDIQFFQAGDKHLGFTRSYGGQTYRVYANRGSDSWDIPSNPVILGFNLRVVARDTLTIGPRGFCVTQEVNHGN